MPTTFKLTKNHIKLLSRAYWRMNEYETGAPEIDGKRPYGNSFVAGDVAEIIGMKVDKEEGMTDEQERDCLNLHHETLTAIRVILSTQSFEPGVYESNDRYGERDWKKSKAAVVTVKKNHKTGKLSTS